RLSMLGALGTLSMVLLPLEAFGPPPFDPALLRVLAVLQPTVLMMAAVALGVWAAPRVGLDAPALRAWTEGRPIWPALRPQLAPALPGGLAIALLLVGFWSVVREQHFAAPLLAFELPLATKLLYGGIVEELLLRWGLMSLFVWIAWRIGGAARPVPVWAFWSGLVASSLLFAVGHLPVLYFLLPGSPEWFVGMTLAANFVPGILFGWLFWRWGLEAAMIAHAFAHLLAWAALLVI
ncbi:MAG: CPBP family glutamic-type intramembrane protease, partial [Sphingomicrobium sp.]